MTDDTSENINNTNSNELKALQSILGILQGVSDESRKRIINTVSTFFQVDVFPETQPISGSNVSSSHSSKNLPSFSEDRSMSPKAFMLDKQPHTDVEKVACLAYYLTHYLETPYFKTLDISKINTEAAQRKFSNAAKAVDNATSYGYLAQAPVKGKKQLSAAGELFVQALPDRAEAKQAISMARPKRKFKAKTKK